MAALIDHTSLYDMFFNAMDDQLAEYQIDGFGLVEKGWRVNAHHPIVNMLKTYLITIIPDAASDLEVPHDIITIHPADGITYLNECVVVSYTEFPSENIKKKYNIPDITPVSKNDTNGIVGEYTIKYDLVTKKGFAKLCDSDTTKYRMCQMPEGYIWGYWLGVGVHFTGDDREHYADFYFVHNDRSVMREFFGALYPEYNEDFDAVNRCYCVTVDQRTGQAVRLKRYIYWDDKPLTQLGLI